MAEHDLQSYIKFIHRLLPWLGSRILDGDARSVKDVIELRDELDEIIAGAVKMLVEEQGFTWEYVGREFGITRQAAWERWSPKSRRNQESPSSAAR